ncbi:MAG: ABC transporter permease subunit [Bacteroides sp.]|nr:ABC transporter permease subunit [Bacteroides sp.]MCM1550652.1 ABC transporter permease subunit [Clostridium sp.]
MKGEMLAIIKRDIRGVTANRRLFLSLLIVPLVLTIVVPSIFILVTHYVPEEMEDFQKMLEQMQLSPINDSLELTVIHLVLNYILPIFFLLIPIMSASIMSASAFVGEKEKHTLETLLYCPLSLKQIFQAKVLASFLLSMFVAIVSFIGMLLVLETELFFIMHSVILPDMKWLLILFLVSPAISLIAITLMVRISAKAQGVEDAQQSAVFLILPILFLIIGQFAGILLINAWLLLGIGILSLGIAVVLFRQALRNFKYEMLLK